MPSLENIWVETERAAHRMAEALRTRTDSVVRRALEQHFEEVKRTWRAAAHQGTPQL